MFLKIYCVSLWEQSMGEYPFIAESSWASYLSSALSFEFGLKFWTWLNLAYLKIWIYTEWKGVFIL